MANALIEHLNTFSESDWLSSVDAILPDVHPVDREAVQIWFRFYPLELRRYIAATGREESIRGLALQGDFELEKGISTSHHFLYGHRYWAAVKCKIEKFAAEYAGDPSDLTAIIKEVGMRVAEKHSVERPLVNAIAAVGLATLNQVGLEAFQAASGDVTKPAGVMAKSPDAIVAERAKDDSQGLLGFLKTVDKKFTVRFAANAYKGKFPVTLDEEVVSASQHDTSHDWRSFDDRCWEGPIPVECTAASCGTCWVGVLGGPEKLSEVSPRERRQMKVFGYNQPEEERPFLRLACQTRAQGNVTLVIPPWNGVFGKKVYGNVEEVELEPVTTSAKNLREVVRSATKE